MLASCWDAHRDELVADMQQTYGVNIMRAGLANPDMDQSEAEWLGALCAQLPPGARVRVAEDPDSAWSGDEWFLRSIDHSVKAIAWALGRGKGAKPKPADTPAEQARKMNAARNAESSRSFVDQILGIKKASGTRRGE